MRIDTVHATEGAARLLWKYELPVILWATCSVDGGKYQAIICEYSSQFAVAVYDSEGELVERFNVSKSWD